MERKSESKGGSNDARPSPPTFALSALLDELAAYDELDLPTLTFHLRQSDATAGDGYWHAAINEARSALETLVASIVRVVGEGVENKPGTKNGTPFGSWRRFLVDERLLDAEENELLTYVYGMTSAKGSHRGVTDEAWGRLARRIVFCAAQHVVQRYARWKRTPRARAVAPPSSSASWARGPAMLTKAHQTTPTLTCAHGGGAAEP